MRWYPAIQRSDNETLWNVRRHQSALAPENLTPLPHFSVTSAISLPKSAGEPASTVPPRPASRAFMLGSATPALVSLLSLSTRTPHSRAPSSTERPSARAYEFSGLATWHSPDVIADASASRFLILRLISYEVIE